MTEPSDFSERRGSIESYLRTLPGFKGYLEKEYRRESDAMVRQWLADRLQSSKKGIDDLARPMAEAGQLDLLPSLDRLRARLDKLIGRIRGAMQGYSGFFDYVQVDEARLKSIYDHDFFLIGRVRDLAQSIEALPQKETQLNMALADIHRELDDLEKRWDARDDLLRGWQDAEPMI